MKRIICLVGESGSGKSTVAEILGALGFHNFSLSSEVKRRTQELGILHPTREDWRRVANGERETYGADCFSRRIIEAESFQRSEDIVVDGVRNLAEIDAFRKIEGSQVSVWGIMASPSRRYERILSRRDVTGSLTFEQFIEGERRELGLREESLAHQQTRLCLMNADQTIDNETENRQDLLTQIQCRLRQIGFVNTREEIVGRLNRSKESE